MRKNLFESIRSALAILALTAVPLAHADTFDDYLGAVKLGNAHAVTKYLQQGMDPDAVDENGNSVLIVAAREGDTATVKALLAFRPRLYQRNPAGDTALMLAALNGHLDTVRALVDAGAPVEDEGWNPLLYAAFNGHNEIVQELLARGAKVDAQAPNGATALMLAARNGHTKVVATLLKAGARTDHATDQGATAASWAQENGNTDALELLQHPPVPDHP